MRTDERSRAAGEDGSIEEVFPSPTESLRLLPLDAAIVALVLVPLWLKAAAFADVTVGDELPVSDEAGGAS